MAEVLTWKLPRAPRSHYNSRPEQPKKRRYAPKTKTGCDGCKRRHLKCDERKPACSRCLKARLPCTFSPPRAWIFEPSIQVKNCDAATQQECRGPIPTVIGGLPKSLEFEALSTEERRALQFWCQCTSPWLANFSSNNHRKVWDVVFPRCAIRLPATRHLLVAVAMIDEHLPETSHDMLMRRSQRIMRHYNAAIKELTGDSPAKLDVLVAKLLAWALEIILGDQSNARMHLEASEAFPEKFEPHRLYSEDEEAHDILMQYVVPLRGDCCGFLSSQKALEVACPKDKVPVMMVLTVKNHPVQISSLHEARDAFASYLSHFKPSQTSNTKSNVQKTVHTLNYWKVEMLKYRFEGPRHPVIIVAIHLLHSLSMTLLVTQPCNWKSEKEYPDPTAMEYILDKSTDFLVLQDLCYDDRAELETTLRIVLTNILRFSRNEAHRTHATSLLQQYISS